MHIILGGTGKVGSAVARALLQMSEPVTVVTRKAESAIELKAAGATVAVVDIRDTGSLNEIFRTGKRAFLLNPPADPSTDTDKEERLNVQAIIQALDQSGLEKVVAASTYGAFAGEACGDLTVLHELEERLRLQPIPTAINRGAYYMSNWSGMRDVVRDSGKLPSFFPTNLSLPMVAPDDLGQAAAARLIEPPGEFSITHVEGPRRYTAQDVADAFSEVFGKEIGIDVIPRDALKDTFKAFGFSDSAADSYACMTAAVVEGRTSGPISPERGRTTLQSFISGNAVGL